MDFMYLGWGNPRSAYTLTGHPIVVLVDGDNAVALQGQRGQACKDELTAMSHHLCGVKHSGASQKLLASLKVNDEHRVNAYNAIFDKHFGDQK